MGERDENDKEEVRLREVLLRRKLNDNLRKYEGDMERKMGMIAKRWVKMKLTEEVQNTSESKIENNSQQVDHYEDLKTLIDFISQYEYIVEKNCSDEAMKGNEKEISLALR